MGVLWDLAERAGVTCFGTSASYIAACMKDGVEPGAGRDLSRAALGRLDRLAARARGLRVDLRARRRGHLAVLDLRRHRRLHRLRRRRPAPARLPRRAAGPRARLRGRGLGRGRQAADRRGRRARDHRADAVDAGLLLGRRGRLALPRELLRACSRASGATATGSRSPRAARRSSTAAPTRPSTAQGVRMGTSEIYRAVPAVDEVARRARRRRPAARHRGLDAAVRRPARGRRARRRADRARSQARIRERCSPRHVPDEVYAIAEVPRTLSGKVLEVPVKRILTGTPRRAGGQPRLARQPGGARLLRRARGRARDLQLSPVRGPDVGKDTLLEQGQERLDDTGVELRPGMFLQLLACLLR